MARTDWNIAGARLRRRLEHSRRYLAAISVAVILPVLTHVGISYAETIPTAADPEALVETDQALERPGPRPLVSLEAYLRAQAAWKTKDTSAALRAWREAARSDPSALAPQVALGVSLLLRDPASAAEAWRSASRILWTDYRSGRWAARHGLLLLALTGSFGALILGLGLVLRQIRMVHHTVSETLSWSINAGRAAGLLAGGLLALPLLSGLGPLATLVFYLFLCAHRFRRSERMLALAVAAWALLLGPVLLACGSLWARNPSGWDASLIAEVQLDPASPPNLESVERWGTAQPEDPVPDYLRGLGTLHSGDPREAVRLLGRAGASGEIPPAVVETNLGNAWEAQGRPDLAIQHYERALANDPGCFEAYYNLSLVLATLGRYVEADRALDGASRVDLDRLRSLGRAGLADGPSRPLDAFWSSPELWTWNLRHPSPADPPVLLAGLLPLRSLYWGAPLVLLALLLGLGAGRWVERLLRVHVCYQCGTPVCRRCLKRIDRRAYCRKCAESMGGLGAGESTRILIRRLLDERPPLGTQIYLAATHLAPGLGAILRGHTVSGAAGSLLAGLAAALWLYPAWGGPATPLPQDALWLDLAASGALASLILALGVTVAGIRSGAHRRGSLKVFLDRDVDRMAA